MATIFDGFLPTYKEVEDAKVKCVEMEGIGGYDMTVGRVHTLCCGY